MIVMNVNVRDNITTNIKKKIAQLDKVSAQAFTVFKAHTPIKTGNARSRTTLKKDTIVAAYPYAQQLDNGRSRQAPDGMSRPTEAFMQKTADKIMKRK